MREKIKILSKQYFQEIVDIRRHLHKYPELSFQEDKTSSYIKSILDNWGVEFTDNYARTGVVAIIRGKSPDYNTTALRADFDALPILEENNVEYCSVNKGIMHACGHDAHTASLLGALKIINTLKQDFKGTIKFVFQPAEERLPGGAQQMIKEGVLKNPEVRQMYAQHVFPDLEVGKVGFKTGIYMASTDEIYINILGVGGHAALPEHTRNPIIAASSLINSLYDFFYRKEEKPCIFSIGFINAEGSTNVIPDNLKMMGTFRCLDDTWRYQAHSKMLDIANGIKKEFGVDINFEIRKGYPVLENNTDLTLKAISLAKKFLGKEAIVDLSLRMTAEDFSYYTKEVPSCFFRLGTSNHKLGITHNLHTSKFDIDEKSLEIGMGLMAWLAINH